MSRRLFLSLPLLLVVLASPAAAADSAARPLKAVKGTLPQNQKYWEYQSWYVNHSVVDVFVNGQDYEHLAQVLRDVKALVKKQVLIRAVVVVGDDNATHLDSEQPRREEDRAAILQKLKTMPLSAAEARELSRAMGHIQETVRLEKAAFELGLIVDSPVGGLADLFSRLKVENSPAWIVTYHGKQYVYDGYKSVTQFFSEDGTFTDRED